jgi:hypothetical protein
LLAVVAVVMLLAVVVALVDLELAQDFLLMLELHTQ